MTNDSDIQYGDSAAAARAIHSALYGICAAAPGKKITKLAFTWNADGSMATAKAYEAAVELFTLTFVWNADLTLQSVERS